MNIIIYIAHVDDDVLLAGGTIAKLAQSHHIRIVYANNGLVVHGRKGGANYRREAGKIAEILKIDGFDFLNIPTMEFEHFGQLELNKRFEALGYEADLIITHSQFDPNQDHKLVFTSALIQSRCIDRKVGMLCCEPHIFPNFFVDITDFYDVKLELMKTIDCEMRPFPHPRSYEAMESLAKFRGSMCGCMYAEAFEAKRWII